MDVSYSTILLICENLKTINSNLKDDMSTINSIKSKVENKTIWDGGSSYDYTYKLKKQLGSLELLTASLDLCISNMIKSIENYQEVDKQVAEKLSTLGMGSSKLNGFY